MEIRIRPSLHTYAILALFAVIAFSCSSHKPVADFSFHEEKNRFRSDRYGCEMQLPMPEEWNTEPVSEEQSDIVFHASHPGKILYVFLAAESLNSDLEDYFLLLKVSNQLDRREGYELHGKRLEQVNGEPALRFVYTAEIEDPELGATRFTYVNVLFRRGPVNFRLMVYTLTEAFERKRDFIEQVIRGMHFDPIKPERRSR